jgi:hypothetical protein
MNFVREEGKIENYPQKNKVSFWFEQQVIYKHVLRE